MNAKILLTALALGGAAVYAVRQFKARRRVAQPESNDFNGMPSNNKFGKVPAFSATRTPTPPY